MERIVLNGFDTFTNTTRFGFVQVVTISARGRDVNLIVIRYWSACDTDCMDVPR